MSKLQVGDSVLTKWDDSDKLLKAEIGNIYRGHRGMKYQVRMKDGSFETIREDQIVIKGKITKKASKA